MKTKSFNKLTPAQKRVAIARDVIAQLKSKQFIATNGQWVGFGVYGENNYNGSGWINQKSVKSRKCFVCAKGAILCSLVGKENKFNEPVIGITDGDIYERLDGIFSPEQLKLIENHFDLFVGDYSLPFFRKFPVAADRLVAIMRNIVRHRGTFKP